MTLQIYDSNGRESFYQWDLNQKLTSSDLKEDIGDVSSLLNEIINVQENYIGGDIE